jgi:EAL and modified HD-GYP domain-containing signal transduction protein
VKSFLQRSLPWLFGKPPPRRQTTRAAPPAPAAERRGPPVPSPEDEAKAAAELAAISARRPLIASSGAVAGFEFRIGDEVTRCLKRQSDAHARAARVAALLASAYRIGQTGRIGFARMPAAWLVHVTGADVGPGVMIGLESTPSAVPIPQSSVAIEQAVLTLRARGVQIGWEPDFDAHLPPDFVMLRQGANAMSTLLDARGTWPPAWQGLPILVTDICDVEELEMALYNGVTYVCGVLDRETSSSDPASQQPVPPEVRRVGLLLNQLVAGADTAVIVNEIKGDIGLSYRLLRLINNATYAQLGGHASVEQAVLLLGRYELYRWLSMLLVEFAGSRKAVSAMQELTLWRSRLLELMAMEQREDAPDQFFTLGLASMLGQLLKISQAEVVSTLNLPAYAAQALLEQAGPWHPYLELTKRLEARTLHLGAEPTPHFGDTARLLMLSDQAWRWAAEQNVPIDTPVAVPSAPKSARCTV